MCECECVCVCVMVLCCFDFFLYDFVQRNKVGLFLSTTKRMKKKTNQLFSLLFTRFLEIAELLWRVLLLLLSWFDFHFHLFCRLSSNIYFRSILMPNLTVKISREKRNSNKFCTLNCEFFTIPKLLRFILLKWNKTVVSCECQIDIYYDTLRIAKCCRSTIWISILFFFCCRYRFSERFKMHTKLKLRRIFQQQFITIAECMCVCSCVKRK